MRRRAPIVKGPRLHNGSTLGPVCASCSCSENEDVSVRIANTRLACSPCLIGWWQLDYRTTRGKLIVQPIHVSYPKKGVCHSGPLGLIRLKMKPYTIPSDAKIAWARLRRIWWVGKHFLKSQDSA